MTEHIESYVHEGRIGVLVHLECNDGITPRTNDFKDLAKDIAMHIAASKPICISSSEIPPDIRNKELEPYHFEKYDEEERIIKIEIANGRVDRQYSLLEQPFIKDPEIKIKEMIDNVSSNIGDKIQVRRFTRWEIDKT